ncbi:WD40-repeat-containing domain protein [Radiomyces spectabilis]|uniref:WD40-repeat-containing domain protein n=1 Tax=Radiomyces spectabilis TaxID=64574 RepID=UPI002220A2F1|nr:WD40-repeat-containing domain protein [Radiomyces spectabilis]KAI8394023.1 WD40-repeat-containing domain protein [Radiomyces spectabilis]
MGHKRYGYVALAGARGMAMVHETSTGWSASFNSGPGMNNSIRLSRHQNEIRVTVCNNDHTIKVYRVPSMEKLFTLNMPTAINHTAMSPDGTKMLAASDGGDVYVYDVQGAGEYKLLATYKASSEPALSCAWNQSSEIFAVTSQDGFINVWNIHGEKLCQLGSTEGRKTRRAARAVQFSKGPLDLLAYSEHVSTVNIIDTRTFKSRQVVRLAPSDMDYHIAGMTFSPDNQSLFVALEKSLVELKVDVSARRQFPSHRIHLF